MGRLPSRGDGSIVLDIGGTIGALIVYAPRDRIGAEVEIRPHDSEWAGVHTAVRERSVADRELFAGLFPALEAGTYEIRWRGRANSEPKPVEKVCVLPSRVTETTLQ